MIQHDKKVVSSINITWMSHFSTIPLASAGIIVVSNGTVSPSLLIMPTISFFSVNSNLAMPETAEGQELRYNWGGQGLHLNSPVLNRGGL